MEAGPVHVADLHQIHGGEDGVVDLEDCAVLRSFLQQIAAGAHIHRGVGDDLLADGVHGRVGHLGEELLEVAEQGLVLFRQHRQRCVHAHGGGGLRPTPGHGEDSVLHLLIGVAEGLVQPVPPLLGGPLHTPVGDGKIPQVYQVGIEPLAVGLLAGVPLLDLGVVHQSTGSQVCQQHPPRLEPGLLHDLLRRDVQHPHLGGENQLLVGSEIPPAGAQAVPVQHRAHRVPIGEHDGRPRAPSWWHSSGRSPASPGSFSGRWPRVPGCTSSPPGAVGCRSSSEIPGCCPAWRSRSRSGLPPAGSCPCPPPVRPSA